MKAQTINWTTTHTVSTSNRAASAQRLSAMTQLLTRSFFAAVGTLALFAGIAVLVAMPQYDNLLQAALWTGGLVFLALAVEVRRPVLAALTGVTLPVIAQLSYHLASEWAMLSAPVLAGWLLYAIFNRK